MFRSIIEAETKYATVTDLVCFFYQQNYLYLLYIVLIQLGLLCQGVRMDSILSPWLCLWNEFSQMNIT